MSVQRRWKSVWRIPEGQHFSVGKTDYLKLQFGFARSWKNGVPSVRFFAPWKRVRSFELVKADPFVKAIIKALAKSSPFTNLLTPGVFPADAGGTIRGGRVSIQPSLAPGEELTCAAGYRPEQLRHPNQTGPSA